MSRALVAYLAFFTALFIIPMTAWAQGNHVQLTSTVANYAIGEYIYATPDPGGNFTMQDIAARYKNNIRGMRNQSTQFELEHNTSPLWVMFEIDNQSTTRDWVLDFGGMGHNRAGVIDTLQIYDATRRTLIYDSENTPLFQKPEIYLNIPTRSKSVYIAYIDPASYKKLSFELRLKRPALANSFVMSGVIIDMVPLVVGVIMTAILIGLFIAKFIGFLSVIAFYGLSVFGLYFIEKPLHANILGLDSFAVSMPLLLALMVSVTAIVTIPKSDNGAPLRFVMLAMVGLLALTFIAITTFIPLSLNISTALAYGVSIISYGVVILFLMSNRMVFIRPIALCLAGWVACVGVGQLCVVLAIFDVLPSYSIIIHADYMMIYPQAVFVMFGVFLSIKIHQTRRVQGVMRQAQKAHTLLKEQKSKESNDHSRLLRVIEREREIMEELRGRESERAEEMRMAKVNADEANQAKSAFLAVVSHEIRTPMTGVMGMIRMLESTSLNDDQKNYVMTIKDSGDAMVSLLNDILDFSKIEGGGMELEEINFDMPRVTNGVMMLMKGHADQKNLELVLDIDSNVPTTLFGDPTRLRQVFLNLIGNALKFTDKGHVALRIQAQSSDSAGVVPVHFAIEDTGIGISKEAQENLFNPFSQADSTISRKYGGTGLGLTICQKLVNAMGGEIQITSREGQGTTFHFTIPFQADDTQSASDVSETLSPPAPLTVSPMRFLVVDDNEVNRKVITAMLGQRHHTTESASGGVEAIEILKSDQSFDAVFLDIEMPDMNGRDVATHLLNDDATRLIPLIALTGNVSDDDVQSYQNIGFSNHLAKPINPEKLYAMINELSSEDFEISTTRHEGYVISFEDDDDDFGAQEIGLPNDAPIRMTEQTEDDQKTSQSPLDLEMVEGLKSGLGVEQTQGLLKDLYIKTDEIMGQMAVALDENNMDELQDRAHELKGMAGNFGFKGVSLKSAEIEKIAKNKTTTLDDLRTHKEDLTMLIERSKITIDSIL